MVNMLKYEIVSIHDVYRGKESFRVGERNRVKSIFIYFSAYTQNKREERETKLYDVEEHHFNSTYTSSIMSIAMKFPIK